MRPSELLAALHTAEKLKDTTRHCYTSGWRHESVAEHSWRIALMAFFLRDEFPEADMDKVTRMCLIHDLGECFTGDIPAFDKTAQDESTEEALLYQWVASLPSPCREEMRALYDEMAALETQEAQIYKAFDVIASWASGTSVTCVGRTSSTRSTKGPIGFPSILSSVAIARLISRTSA